MSGRNSWSPHFAWINIPRLTNVLIILLNPTNNACLAQCWYFCCCPCLITLVRLSFAIDSIVLEGWGKRYLTLEPRTAEWIGFRHLTHWAWTNMTYGNRNVVEITKLAPLSFYFHSQWWQYHQNDNLSVSSPFISALLLSEIWAASQYEVSCYQYRDSRLIFNMGTTYLWKTVFIIRRVPADHYPGKTRQDGEFHQYLITNIIWL